MPEAREWLNIVPTPSDVAIRVSHCTKHGNRTKATSDGRYTGTNMTPVVYSSWKRVSGRCRSSNAETYSETSWNVQHT